MEDSLNNSAKFGASRSMYPNPKQTILLITLGLLLTISSPVLSSSSAYSPPHPTVITSCDYAITQPGLYVLDSNVNCGYLNTAVTIDSSNVVLNCNGFGFTTSALSPGYGVDEVTPLTNVKVLDCSMNGFFTGFWVGSTNSVYSWDRALNSGQDGFCVCYIYASSNSFYFDSASAGTGNGYVDIGGHSNTFVLSTANHNGGDGFYTKGNGDHFGLDGANYNGYYGFANLGTSVTFYLDFCVGNTAGPSTPPGLCYS
jgi:hypothetical protein